MLGNKNGTPQKGSIQRQNSLVHDEFMRSDDFTEVYSNADDINLTQQQSFSASEYLGGTGIVDNFHQGQQGHVDMTPPNMQKEAATGTYTFHAGNNHVKQQQAQLKSNRRNTIWVACLSMLALVLLGILIALFVQDARSNSDIDDINRQLRNDGIVGARTRAEDGTTKITQFEVTRSGNTQGYVVSDVIPKKMQAVSTLSSTQGYWSYKNDMLVPTSDFQAIYIPDKKQYHSLAGKIMVIGGHDDNLEQIEDHYLNNIYVYDPRYDNFEQFAPLPQRRSKMAAVQVGHYIFVIGGYQNRSQEKAEQPESGMLTYDLVGLEGSGQGYWLSGVSTSKNSEMKEARSDFCAAAIGDKVYAVGGRGKGSTPLSSIEEYDTKAGTWRTMKATLPSVRSDVACTAMRGKIYVAGGNAGDDYSERFQKDLLEFDPVKDKVRQLAPVQYARGDAQLLAFPKKNRLLLVGGEYHYQGRRGQVALHNVEEYIVEHDVWIERPPMAEARFRFGATVYDDTAFVFGGHPTCIKGWPSSCVPDALRSVEAFYDSEHPDIFISQPPGPPLNRQLNLPVSLDSNLLLKLTPEPEEGYVYSGSVREGAGYWSEGNILTHLSKHGMSDFGTVPLGGNEVLIFGGVSQSRDLSKKPTLLKGVFALNVALGTAIKLEDMPEPRARFAFAKIGDLVYVVNGVTEVDGIPDNSVSVYNVKENLWEVEETLKLNTPRSDACAVEYRGKLYVIGGYTLDGDDYIPLNSVEVFDPKNPKKKFVELDVKLPSPRGDLKCAVYGNDIYVLGGVEIAEQRDWDRLDQVFRPDFESYNEDTGEWQKLTDMPFSVGDMAFVSVPNRGLLALGGETFYDEKNTKIARHQVYEYNVQYDTWIQRAPLPQGRFRFDAVYANGAVHVIGGQVTCENPKANCPTLASQITLHGLPDNDVYAYVKKQ